MSKDECLGTETEESRALQNLFDNQYTDLYKRLSLYYQACLSNSSEAQEYLISRGVSLEVAERYELGYAPDDNRALLTKLRECGYRPEDLAILGVTGSSGYATFRNRIMFPIRDFSEEVVGFGSRFIGTHAEAKAAGVPKYLNTKDNPKFKKYKTFYTGSFANRSRCYSGNYILVEGYMDVIKVCEALRDSGRERCVLSPMSSNITQGHVNELISLLSVRLSANPEDPLLGSETDIVVCFDADSAGKAGSKKTCETLESAPALSRTPVRYLPLPEGKDPDEFLALRGEVFFDALIQTATPHTEYEIIETLNAPIPQGRVVSEEKLARVRKCTELLGTSSSPAIIYNEQKLTTYLIKQIAYYWMGYNARAAFAAEQSILADTLAIRRGKKR